MKRKNITQSSNKGLYNSPTIVRYNTIETNFNNEQFFHDEPDKTNIIDNDDDILNTDELQNSNDLVIEDSFPEDKISYSSCSVICDNLYHDIKNNNQISNYVIGLLLEMRHVINNTKNKSIVISRLIKQTENYKHIFSDMKENSNIFLNKPSKIQHKQSHK